MNRILALVISLSLIFALVSCESEDTAIVSSEVDNTVSDSVAPESEAISSETISATESTVSVAMPENDYSEHTFNVVEYKDFYKLTGRYAETIVYLGTQAHKCYSFDNTAQMLAFNADCEGDAVLTVAIKPTKAEPMNNCYFSVYVDGIETRMSITAPQSVETKQTLTLATGLKKGTHKFEIYRDTEFAHGTLNVISVTLNGVLTERPSDKNLHIEFLGDSITAGYGNLTQRELNEPDASGPAKSDGSETYAFLTARELDADVTMVARSGLAFSYNPVEDYWNRVSYTRSSLGNYTPARQPDVVVINLGTNDHGNYANKGLTIEQVEQRAVDLIKLVRSTRPNAKIVWMYGMMGSDIELNIKSAIKTCGGEASGIYYLGAESNSDGGGWHPSAKAHQKASVRLVNKLNELIK